MNASGPHGAAMSGRVFILMLALAALLVVLSFVLLSLIYPSDESDPSRDVTVGETRVEFGMGTPTPAATGAVPVGG